MSGDEVFETSTAIERLLSYQDDSVSPQVVEFSHFLAGRLGSRPIVPAGFAMEALLSVNDLSIGIDGWSGEPIEGSLAGLTKEEYAELLCSLPDLARLAFTQEFAESLLQHMIKIGLLTPPPNDIMEQTLHRGEIILDPIDNIDDAHSKIIDAAKTEVCELDWQSLGISREDAEDIFNGTFALILRQAPYSLPLNIFVDSREYEAALLPELLPQQKRHLRDKYWLVLTSEVISPDMAMLTKDHLFLKAIESISSLGGVDSQEALEHFKRKTNGSVWRAITRLDNYLRNNPGIIRTNGI